MKKHRFIIVSLLLSLVTLTVVAQEDMPLRGCRVGTPRPVGMALRRGAPTGVTKHTGGDFYHGERHQLTVLAAFNDRLFKGDEAATITQWNKIFNTENLTENPFKGSVHDYFMDQSYGDFNLVFDLVYVQVSGNAEKYASTQADDENSQYLVQDILEVLKTRNIDWSLYDWNGDGFINQLLVIYAGHGMNDSSGSNLIWPHQWWMSEHLKDKQEGVYCDPIPVNYGGKKYKVDCYCALAELTKNDDYGSFGTICHEYTHCFGFPDFYSDKSYVGAWELMDMGNYNGEGYSPAGYSAHERWLMGWLTPTELTTATTVSNMPALSDEPKAYLIRNDGYQNEYYIVENRQQDGWDASLPGNGIIVSHVDYDAPLWVSVTSYVNTSSRQHYLIFPANDITSTSKTIIKNWSYPYYNNNSLTNSSTPAAIVWNANSDGKKFMNKPLTNMTVTGGLASFNFTATPTGLGALPSTLGQQPTVLYRFGSIDIIRTADGKTHKVARRH